MKKNSIKFLWLLGLALFLTGCVTMEEPKEVEVKKVESDKFQEELSNAENLYKRGDWQGAFLAYSNALDECEDQKVYRTLQVKRSNALYKMGNYAAALAALAPMPTLPGTLNDCQKLAMAAQILTKMNSKIEYIEALWEVALDNTVDEEGIIAFKADGYARLGKIYFEQQKSAHAIKCFEFSADLYKILGDSEKEKMSRNIMEYLR